MNPFPSITNETCRLYQESVSPLQNQIPNETGDPGAVGHIAAPGMLTNRLRRESFVSRAQDRTGVRPVRG